MRLPVYYFMILLSTAAMPSMVYAQEGDAAALEAKASNGDVDAQLTLAARYMSGDGVDINLNLAQNLLNDAQRTGGHRDEVLALQRRLSALRQGEKLSNTIAGVQQDGPSYDDMHAAIADTTLEPVSLVIGVNRDPSALRSDRDGLLSLYPTLLQDTGFALPRRDTPSSDGHVVYSGVITNIRNPRRADLLCHLLKLAACDEQRTPILNRPKNMPVDGTMRIPRMDVRAEVLPPPPQTPAIPQFVASTQRAAMDAFDNGSPPASQAQADTRVRDMAQRLVDVEARVQTAQALAMSESHARQLAEQALHAEQEAQAPRVSALRAAEDRLKALEDLKGTKPGDLATAKAMVAKAQHDLDESAKRLQSVQDEKDHAQLHELALQGELRVAHAATDLVQSRLDEAQKQAKGFADQVAMERAQEKLKDAHTAEEQRALHAVIDGLTKDRDASRQAAQYASDQISAMKQALAAGEDRMSMKAKLVEQEKAARQAAEREVDAELHARTQAEHAADLAKQQQADADHAADLARQQAVAAKNDAEIAHRQEVMQHTLLLAMKDRDAARTLADKDSAMLDQVRGDMDQRQRDVNAAEQAATQAALQLGNGHHGASYNGLIQRVRSTTERVLTIQHQLDAHGASAPMELHHALDVARQDHIHALDAVAAAASVDKQQQGEIEHSLSLLKQARDRVGIAEKGVKSAQDQAQQSKARSDAAQQALVKMQAELTDMHKAMDDEQGRRRGLERDLKAARISADQAQKDLLALKGTDSVAQGAIVKAKAEREALESAAKTLSKKVSLMEQDAQRNHDMLAAAQRLASAQANALKDEDKRARALESEAIASHEQLVRDNAAAAAALKDAVAKAQGEGQAELRRIQADANARMSDLEARLRAAQAETASVQQQRAIDIKAAEDRATQDALHRVDMARQHAQAAVDSATNTMMGRPVYPEMTPAVAHPSPASPTAPPLSVPAPVVAPLPTVVPPKPGGGPGTGGFTASPLPAPPVLPVAQPIHAPALASAPVVAHPAPIATRPSPMPAASHPVTPVVAPPSIPSHPSGSPARVGVSASPAPAPSKANVSSGWLSSAWNRVSVIWGGGDTSTDSGASASGRIVDRAVSSPHPAAVSMAPAPVKPVLPPAPALVSAPRLSSSNPSPVKGPTQAQLEAAVRTQAAPSLPPIQLSSVQDIPALAHPSAPAAPSQVVAPQPPATPMPMVPSVSTPPASTSPASVASPHPPIVSSGSPSSAHTMEVHAASVHASPTRPAVRAHGAHKVVHRPDPVSPQDTEDRMMSMTPAPSPATAPVTLSPSADNGLVPIEMHLPPGVHINTGDDDALMAIPQRAKPPVDVSAMDGNLSAQATDGTGEVVSFGTLSDRKSAEIEIGRLRMSLPSNLAAAHFYLRHSARGYTVVATGFGDYGDAAAYCRAVRAQGESCSL